MHARKILTTAAVLSVVVAVAGRVIAQGPPAPPAAPQGADPAARGRGAGPGQGAQGGRGRATFPAQQRALADAATIERGKTIYSVTCTSCHGGDLRGGQLGGPNLLRSSVVLSDDLPDLLAPILEGSRAEKGMPALPMPRDDVRAVAAYLHSVVATSRGQGAPPPGPPVVLNVLVGDATAGAAYFASKCSTCHSATGDLQGIGARLPDAKAMQNHWVAGGRGSGAANPRRTVTAVVTPAGGAKVEGRLVRYDDFTISIALADGTIRTFARDGDRPAVEIRDPLAQHRAMLPTYTDKDMHDVTAYLVTLK